MRLHPSSSVPIVSLVRCGYCRHRIAATTPNCRYCGTPVQAAPSAPIRRVRTRRLDPLSLEMRRWMLVLLTILVGGTSFGLTAYVRLHRPLERADVKNLECDLIDEQGEYYFGELQDCRNRLAYLRVVERAEAKQPRSLDSSTAVP